MKNWLKVFFEFNQDLTKTEILVVGEKEGTAFKYAFELPDGEYKLPIIVNNINIAIEEYLGL